MSAIVFSQIVESNQITIVALDDQPMHFLVRINGNVRTITDAQHLMGREASRAERGPLTA